MVYNSGLAGLQPLHPSLSSGLNVTTVNTYIISNYKYNTIVSCEFCTHKKTDFHRYSFSIVVRSFFFLFFVERGKPFFGAIICSIACVVCIVLLYLPR